MGAGYTFTNQANLWVDHTHYNPHANTNDVYNTLNVKVRTARGKDKY